MSNPFQEHAQNRDDYLVMLKGYDASGGATLSLGLNPNVIVDCTFEKIIDDFDLITGGKSPKLMVPDCVFSLATVPAQQRCLVRKGLKTTLITHPGGPPYALQLWAGGEEQGGLAWRGMLVSENYSA